MVNISANNISWVRNGIRCRNITSTNPGSITGNTITLDNSQYVEGVRYRGIDIEGCSNINITGTNSVTGYSYENGWQNGIEIEYSDNVNVECNNVQTFSQGIWLGGTTPNVFLWGNQMTDCYYSIFYNYNSNFNDQGMFEEPGMCGYPCDNQWIGTYTNSIMAYYTYAYQHYYFVRSTPDRYNPPQSSSNQYLGYEFTFIPMSCTSRPDYCSGQVPARYANGSGYHFLLDSAITDSLQYKLEREIAKNEVPYIVNVEEYRYAGKDFLYNQLMDKPQMLNIDSAFVQAKDSLENTNIATLYNYMSLVSDTTLPDSVKITQLKAINNNLQPTNLIEENQKTVNAISLKIKEQGLSVIDTTDKTTLYNIAIQCPYTGGKAVYAARVTLSLLGYPDEYGVCNGNEFKISPQNKNDIAGVNQNSIAAKDNVINISPNPSSGSVQISMNENKSSEMEIVFYDMTGREMQHFSLNDKGNNVTLNLTFTDGVYQYRIISEKQFVKTGKLVIIK